MTILTPEINRYSLSVHAGLISLLWNVFGVLAAYISSQRAMYTYGIELSYFFYFPAFMLNEMLTIIFRLPVNENLEAMGNIGSGLVILENLCIVYLFMLLFAWGLAVVLKDRNAGRV